jgi:energy-coupling factor transport system permease protein
MQTELYIDHDSIIHRLDPRTKLVMFSVVFITLLYFQDPLWMFPISCLIVVQALISGSFINLRRMKRLLFVLTISSMVLWLFFGQGTTKLFWIFEWEALAHAVSRTMLILSMITTGILLVSTTRNEEIIVGMVRLGLPYRLGFAISTAVRLVPVVLSNATTIIQAQQSRGLDFYSGNVLTRVSKYIPLLVPIFISSIRHTNAFAMALEAKGFGARPTRTFYLELKLHRRDYLFLALTLLLFVVTTCFWVAGYGQIVGLQRF